MSVQSKFFQVTNQVLLEYRTDQYKITYTNHNNGSDSALLYVYQGNDGNQYCIEKDNICHSKFPDENMSTYYYGGNNVTDFTLHTGTEHSIVGSDIDVNGYNVGVIIKDAEGNELRNVLINHDTIRLYILTGYVMNSIAGYSIRVKARVNKVSFDNGDGTTAVMRINDYMYLLDWFMPKENLKDMIHWLPSPLYMNSKFYDRYIEIKFPAPLDLANTLRGVEYIYEHETDNGETVYMKGNVDANSNCIIEFNTVQSDSVDVYEESDSMYECDFTLDPPQTFSIARTSNANNFNIRIFEDIETHSIVYYPVYGDYMDEHDFDISMMQAIDSGVISMYDASDLDSVNDGMEDFIEMYGDDVYRWVIINELGVTYNYENISGATDDNVNAYTEYYTNTIDYSGKTPEHGEFFKSRFIPNIKHRNGMNCKSIIVTYTAHLYNRMNNIDIVRQGSMMITEPYKYMHTMINTNGISTLKIVNKIQKNELNVTSRQNEPKADKMVRSYYDVTNITIKDAASGQMYTQGKMTLNLTHSGNNYMLKLYSTNNDNSRIPYDLTGPYEYKLVFPSVSGTNIEIFPNKDSQNYNLGIGSLIFYISSDKAKAIMEVPASERYFSLTTHIPDNSREESTLYEGNVEWYV